MSEEKFLSLYDYLGKAAGPELGKKVYEYLLDKKKIIKLEEREIKNKKYTGRVILYPKWFLDEYFTENKTNHCLEHSENNHMMMIYLFKK